MLKLVQDLHDPTYLSNRSLGLLENAMDTFQNAIDGLKDLKAGESGG